MWTQKYYLKYLALLIVCYCISGLTGCEDSSKKPRIDVSGISVHFNPIRFDQKIFALDTNRLKETLDELGNQHPDFAAVYFRELTGFSRTEDEALFHKALNHFLTYKDFRNLYDSVQIKFPDTQNIDTRLKLLFQFIRYYYPQSKYGTVYYFISGLNQWSAVTVDSIVGVGLDMHLGKQYPFYESVQLPYYQIARCEPEYIEVNVCRAIYEDMFSLNPEGKSLLDLMIMRGKELYFMEHMLPDVKEERLIGYTKEQLEWCKKNEGMIWNYFAKNNLLFSTQWQEILRFVNDGPTSTGMPAESPGNIGSWVGWQLVRCFADKNAKRPLQDILANDLTGQQFLESAQYKPKIN